LPAYFFNLVYCLLSCQEDDGLFLHSKDGKNKKQLLFFSTGIYDDDPEIITLDRGEFGEF